MKNLNPSWAASVKSLQAFMAKQNKGSRSEWSNNEYQLGKYFDIAGINTTVEQQKYIAVIEELETVQEVNSETLEFIDIPWHLEDTKPLFWDILRKILIY